jgi:hypothetical protein
MLHELYQQLKPYEPIDLLASFAALRLLPENAGKAVSLDALSYTSVCLRSEMKRPHISNPKLRRICNKVPFSITTQEDPCENAFTESFTFHGGSYVVFPGVLDASTFILRHLSKALFLPESRMKNTEFLTHCMHNYLFILTLSNEIASRIGINHNNLSVDPFRHEIHVPSSNLMQKLKKAVTFTEIELERLCLLKHVPPDVIIKLLADVGSFNIKDFDIHNCELFSKPLVKWKDKIVIYDVGVLLATLRHLVLCAASQFGLLPELAIRYRLALWHTAVSLLEDMKIKRKKISVPRMDEPLPLIEDVFIFDVDKALYVQLVSDDLEDYDKNVVFGHWQIEGLIEKLGERQKLIEDYLYCSSSGLNEIFVLILIETIGRWHVAGVKEVEQEHFSSRLPMSVSDLETITMLRGGDPLLLYKFAKAGEKIRKSTKVFSFSILDEYYHYKEHKESYYFSDEEKPTHIIFRPGDAGKLRRKVLEKTDFHGVPSYNHEYITEVIALHGTSQVPIYVPYPFMKNRVAVLLEDLPILIWVVGPDYEDDSDAASLDSHYVNFGDMICYWLWQFSPKIKEILKPLKGIVEVMRIDINLPKDQRWFYPTNDTDEAHQEDLASEHSIEYSLDFENTCISLTIKPDINDILGVADNAGERFLMTKVLEAIKDLLEGGNFVETSQLTQAEIDEIINSYAPLGKKKKMILLDAKYNPLLDPIYIPSYRPIQEADINEILDDLGEYLRTTQDLSIGPIKDKERTQLLKKGVLFLFNKMKQIGRTIAPQNLFEFLTGHYEATVREIALRDLTLPTRFECFTGSEEIINELKKNIPEANRTALANRFLIEYFLTQPPEGLRPISIDLYDQLQAFASAIIDLGYFSDLIYYEIADTKISILPSGRLGIHKSDFDLAREKFLDEHAKAEVERARRFFERHWIEPQERKSADQDLDSIDPELRDACIAEFGFSPNEIRDIFLLLHSLGAEQQSPMKCFRMQDLHSTISTETSICIERVKEFIDNFSLKPRPDFLQPPAPFKRPDIYPWRFNRRLSYMQRPLLQIIKEGSIYLAWGSRHIYQSFDNLFLLILSARFKAQSTKMKKYLGRINNEKGQAFLNKVCNLLTKLQYKTERKVRSIGNLPLCDSEDDLGDIDILASQKLKRTLYIIECKDLSMARTPHEMRSELEKLFVGRKNEEASVQRIERRVKWLRQNMNAILDFLRLDKSQKWRVKPLLIIDKESFARHLYQTNIEVKTFMEIERDKTL